MKKLLALLSIIFAFNFASPAYDLSPAIYELQIIEADNWKMEINLFQEEYCSPDSFMLKNKSDSAMILTYTRFDSLEWGSVLVVTQDDLSKPLDFDIENEEITLCYFVEGEKFYNWLLIGSNPYSEIHNLDSSQSICWDMLWYEHYKSNTPTIGADNVYEEAIIYGKVFDSAGQPITNSTIAFYPLYNMVFWGEYTGEDGTFQARFSPKQQVFSSLLIKHDNGFAQYWDVNRVEIDLEPGDSIEVNFYSTMTSIRPIILTPISLYNYPQPASSYTWVNIDNTDVDASAMRVNVYALNGRKVDSFIPTAKHFRYDCGHLPQGSYVLSLQHGHEVLASKKLQILK
jgi:hypothetical protein